MKTAPLANSVPSRNLSSWIGPCASFLCLIHCFGFAVFSLLAPAIIESLPHSEVIEISAWVLSSGSAFLTFRGLKVSAKKFGLLSAIVGVGALGLALHSHLLFHGCLITLAIVQIRLVLKAHSSRRNAKTPPCCEHG